MIVKDGYRLVQGLLPARMHKEFTEYSRRMGQSRSETLRQAIELVLQNAKSEKSAKSEE